MSVSNPMFRFHNLPVAALAIILNSFALMILVDGRSCCASSPDVKHVSTAFFSSNCLDCHDSSTAEGGLDLTTVEGSIDEARWLDTWVRIFDKIESEKMPPPDASTLSKDDRKEFLSTIRPLLVEAHAAQKGTQLRRLNASEYQNTLNDLFGTNLKLAELLPPDSLSHEFDNIGSALNMSMVQLQRYLDAADLVLETSIASDTSPPESIHIEASYAKTANADRFLGKNWLELPDGAVVFFQPWGYPTGMLREAGTRSAGWYRIRVTGYAYQSDEPIEFSIGATTFARGLERPTFEYFAMPPGEPTTIELTAWIEDRYMIEITPYGIYDNKYVIKKLGIDRYRGPGLAILNVKLDGPLTEEFPSRGHRLLFDGVDRREVPPKNPKDREKSWYRPRFEIVADDPTAVAAGSLHRVATAAFRRPATNEDIQPYLELFRSQLESGESIEDALKTAAAAILCSPRFLFLQEPSGPLDDFALATRLSYFLTRTSPDSELLEAASKGKLTTDPDALRSQASRLIKSEKFDRFLSDFSESWLNLRELEFTTPDAVLFPEYDQFLLHSMRRETFAYLETLIKEDLPIETLVKSDFVMINSRLADHYGLPEVDGPEIRKVALGDDKASQVRGGFLTQAAVLKASANGTNTSPVVRGVWVLERILGTTPSPPPPGVPGVEPDTRGASTLRQILAKHRNLDNCRSCHQMIDPPGFALESFNPIGAWRDRYRITSGRGTPISKIVHGKKSRYKLGLHVDPSGETLDGKKFDGFEEFRDQLSQEKEILTRTFVEKLLTFATGRELGFSDRDEIDEIVQNSIENQTGIGELLYAVIESDIFRSK
ncbi:hypothetical protein KOR42_51250 [Thalassoglobus neptunius]|uniref:Planctomycete cytochrome C n=1 Tax=Thalassoglobus neptunius TaxID=1938619 RepID=A0A5C5VMH0_9PLAN|nr:DUF1592 domain-containing protein [Thalassoglobus neptunius]TWT39846.1 hypothetical protein KOR42_51250 [Thalassoglobus neptunius]